MDDKVSAMWDEVGKSTSSLSIASRGKVTSRTPNRERMSTPGLTSWAQSVSTTNGQSSSARRWPYFQQVSNVTFFTETSPFHDAGLMWSALSGSSTDSLAIAGSFKQWDDRSQWGYFTSIFETSVVPVRWQTSCKISRLASFPTMVHRIPKSSLS